MELVHKYSKELPFLKELDKIKEEVDSHRPLQKDVENRVMQKLRLDWNYNSNAIEGNSFTYGETVALLMEGVTVKGKPFKDAMDIKGHNNAIDLMMSIIKHDRELSEADVRTLHKVLLVEDYYSAAVTEDGTKTRKLIKVGEYKQTPNHVITPTGETHYYATPEETPVKMRELLEWYNNTLSSSEFHPIVLAAIFHHRFVEIHPFDDGNGRMTRLLTNLILLKFGYPISVVKNETKQNYYARLAQADNGELVPFIELISDTVGHSLEIYLKAINGEDISEPSDIDKEIALFKQKLDIDEKELKSRRPDSAVTISYEIFSFIHNKLEKLSDYFQSKHEFLREKKGGGGTTIITNKLKNFKEYDAIIGKKLSRAESVSYVYNLLKDVKENRHDVWGEIEIRFLNKSYIVNFNDESVTKYYGQEILDSQILELVKQVVKYYMEKIESIYKKD